MKRYILPILALFCAGLLLWWAFSSTPADTFASRGLFAAQGHRDARVAFRVISMVLGFGAGWLLVTENRAAPRRGSSALLIALLFVGCASTQPAVTPAPVSTSTSPCITSSWMYAAIIDGSCTPDGQPDRITWPEWWALQLQDSLDAMREP